MAAYTELEASQLAELIATQEIVLVDVRNDDEVAKGIIPNALHIPLASLPTQYSMLTPEKPIVLYCHSGIRSAKAASFLANNGYSSLFNLSGGVLAWARAGYAFAAKA